MTRRGHMPLTARASLLALLLLGVTPLLAAPAPSTSGAPVELQIKPRIVLLGQPVVISGLTGYHAKAKQLKIQIKHESGKPTEALSAEVQPQGTFSTTFKDTKQLGRYTVEVSGPDGKNTAKGEFRVVSFAGLADELESAFAALDKRERELVKLAHDKIAGLPPTPERDLLIDVIIKLKDNEVLLPRMWIIEKLRKFPPIKVEVTIFGELEDKIDEMKDLSGAGTDILNRTDATDCETINTAIEGAKLAGALFNLHGTVLEMIRKVFIDKAISSLVEAAMEDHAAALALAAELKVAAGALEEDGEKIGGPWAAGGLKKGLKNSWTSIIFDFVEAGAKKVFDVYCVRLHSPLRVKMRMVWKESGTPWYKYGVRLEGRLDLRYSKKNPPGQPIKITGELEGGATNFVIWEDILAVQQFPKGMVPVARRWLSPPPPPPLTTELNETVDFGEVLRVFTTPYSFNVPVEGTLKGDEIELQFKPARIDFSPIVKGRLLFVAIAPSLPVPEWSVFEFPIEKAQWIARRGFGEPGKIKLQKGKDQEGKDIRFIADALDTHRDSPDKSINVDWQIRFDSRLKTVKELPDPTFPF